MGPDKGKAGAGCRFGRAHTFGIMPARVAGIHVFVRPESAVKSCEWLAQARLRTRFDPED
jgi:hypothetical protein